MSNSNALLEKESREVDVLHEIGSRIAGADPLHELLAKVLDFISIVAKFDSCFLYVLEDNELVLRSSKNPHAEAVDRLKLQVGRGITGWVAEHKCPVAIGRDAFKNPPFQPFTQRPEHPSTPFPPFPAPPPHNLPVHIILSPL